MGCGSSTASSRPTPAPIAVEVSSPTNRENGYADREPTGAASPVLSSINGHHLSPDHYPAARKRTVTTTESLYANTVGKREGISITSSQARSKPPRRLLLLGSGNSGKSTLVKQILHLYGTGWTLQRRAMFVSRCRVNALVALQEMSELHGKHEFPALADSSLESYEFIRKLEVNNLDGVFHGMALEEVVTRHAVTLWNDPALKTIFANRTRKLLPEVPETAKDFLDRFADISQASYLPTFTEILNCRDPTKGEVELNFEMEKLPFTVIDVGGQHECRGKWFHLFQGLDLVIFVVAMDEFDQVLSEPYLAMQNKNRMEDNLELFGYYANHKFLQTTGAVVFLNKIDLFREKIKTTPITACPVFADYVGDPHDFDATTTYIVQKFEKVNQFANRPVRVHLCTATDTTNADKLFQGVKQSVIRKAAAAAADIAW